MDLRALSRFAAVVAVATACTSLSVARAQEPSKAAIAAAREVLAMKGATNMFIPVPIGVIETVKRSFLPTNPNLGRELNEVAALLQKEFESKRAELIDDVATIYARHFTEPELKDLVVFFKTPLGQKWAREEPAAIEEGLREAQRWSDGFSEVVMGRFRSEMQKRGHSL